MMNYLIEQLKQDQFYILCMDYSSILGFLDEVENEEMIRATSGNLVVDQLLIAGDGRNRFLSCKFISGKVLLETAENITGTDEYRGIASRLLSQRIDLLKYSTLTETQLESIRQKQAV